MIGAAGILLVLGLLTWAGSNSGTDTTASNQPAATTGSGGISGSDAGSDQGAGIPRPSPGGSRIAPTGEGQ
jgi:hypothetical protein